MRVGTGALKRARRVVLAVVAREDRNDDARTRQANLGSDARDALLGNAEAGSLNGLAATTVREDRLELCLPSLLQRREVERLATGNHLIRIGGHAQRGNGDEVRGRVHHGVVRKLDHKAAVGKTKERIGRVAGLNLDAQLVAHAHLEECLGNAAVARRGDGQRGTTANQALDHVKRSLERASLGRDAVVAVLRHHGYHAMPRTLELGRGHAGDVAHRGGKRDQRGRHVQALKAAGHRVLAADGTNAQVRLGHEGSQHRRDRLAPALGHVAQALEVLLEGEVGILVTEARGHQARDALHHRAIRAVELVGAHEVGVEAPGHARARGGLAQHRQLCRHRHRRRQLRAAAKRHEHGSSADGGVKALGKALVGGHVDVGDQRLHLVGKGASRQVDARVGALLGHVHALVLGRAVGVKELAAHVHDGLAVPHHAQARLGRHSCHLGCLEVLLVSIADELGHVLGREGHGHALLALGDGQLSAVEALVLLRNLVEVNEQAVGQLADGHAHAAGAEVVAALDEAAGVLATEEALQLALDGRVALLHLGTAGLKALQLVGLGAAGGAANAVATGATAQKHDDVTRGRALAAHVLCRGGTHHGADLHALGHIARVIELVDLAGCQANLVAVGGVTRGGRGDQLALRQLAGNGVGHGNQRVRRAGNAHGLVHVAAARERVTDSAADAGGRTTEGLDLGRVVVGLVLEEEEPVLVRAVDVHLHLDGAGVDLFGLVQVLQLARVCEPLGAQRAHVHERDGTLGAAELVAHRQVARERLLDRCVVDGDVLQHRAKRGVAAVVGPVGVDHLDLGDGGRAALAREVLLAEGDVRKVHRQAALLHERGKAGLVKLQEAVERLHHGRLGVVHLQGVALGQRCLASLDGIDDVVLDSRHVDVGEGALEVVHLGREHRRTLALTDELNALACGVRALVKLAREELHRKDLRAVGVGHGLARVVGLRL